MSQVQPPSSTQPQLTGYTMIEPLYCGLRTIVYRAVENESQQSVVIKFLQQDYPTFNELLQFRNQYTITKNLNIPGVIHPYNLQVYGNSYALVMEDVGGISLQNYSQDHSVSLTEALIIASRLAKILHDLHQSRVIHKDIKPANILIHPESKEIWLIDFSIASLLPKETQEIKNPNRLEGTLAYLAPEQTGRMNRGIDYRADFYSLGITLFELLTGQLPFTSSDPMELVHCHLAQKPVSASQVSPDIPDVVSEIIEKLLAKNAEDRYQTGLGLRHDLQICLNQLQETAEIANFVIAQRDISDRFIIPETLYGRNQEIQQLLSAFERVSTGQTELLLVAGFSGIGKTAVINEVHKPIVRQRGYFIKGKYDQFQRNIPFSAFVQAFRDLMGQLLSESDEQLQIWKTQILAAVGDSGQVLIDVIPELENIIGQQPAATELSGTAAQNRFNLLLPKFVQVFTRAEHPLVMFLDDLQWADSASLNLLKLLVQETGHLLILGAYRDNEVSPVHPLMLAIDEMVTACATINTITLPPLSEADLNQLVGDTFNCELALAQPLTELLYQKTKGNPFFATQFLKALHSDKLITFDWEIQHWQCDIAQIKALAVTNDVVEFMALQLQKLPLVAQDVLKLAACIGAEFDLNTLAIVGEESAAKVATSLWRSLQEGLVIPKTKVYKFFAQSGSEEAFNTSANPTYQFLHDRVQQAAYSLIPNEQRQQTHYHIGQLLLKEISPEAREERIFELVNQLNHGVSLITEQSERDELAQLNLIACRKARASTAYQAAREYAEVGLSLLGEVAWKQQYELALVFHELAAEVAMLCGDFEQMDTLIDLVIEQAQSWLERVNVYLIRIQFNSTQNKPLKAIEIALEIMRQFGITFPQTPTLEDVQKEVKEIEELIGSREIADLIHLPAMKDQSKLALLQIINSIFVATYTCGSLLFPLMVYLSVKLSIKYGNTIVSPYCYGNYSIILIVFFQDVNTAIMFSDLAMKMMSKSDDKTFKSQLMCTTGGGIIHRKYHIKETLLILKEGYTSGLEVGDLQSAAANIQVFCYHSFWCGEPLVALEEDICTYYNGLVQLNQFGSANYCRIHWQLVLALLGTSECLVVKQESYLPDAEFLDDLVSANDYYGLFVLYLYKMILDFLFEEIEFAKVHSIENRKYLMGGKVSFGEGAFYFYDSLIALADLSQQSDEISAALQRVAENQTYLEQWAYHAPMNHQHKVDLVAAEKCRVLGQKAEAIDLYDKAIGGAKANEFIQEQALANELAAKFYLAWGKDKIAAIYMQEAYYCYARWGAKAKVVDLEQRYPHLLQPILHPMQGGIDPLKTLTNITNSVKQCSIASISDPLDFSAVIQAAQLLSGKIQLDELLTQLTQILLQSSGADQCILVLLQDGLWKISAISTHELTELSSISLEDHLANIPVKLIQYVKRTESVVMINNLETDLPVIDDYLREYQPKSILSLPIFSQGELAGVLYLGNQITSGVFTGDRLMVIEFLCAQAAISLVNANLYQESQAKTRALEESIECLERTQAELQSSQQLLRLIINNIPQLVFWKTRDFRFLGCNNSAAKAANLESPDQIVGKTDYDFFIKEEADWYRLCDTRVMDSGQAELHIIEPQHQADGRQHWLDTNKIPLLDQDNTVIGILVTVEDITDRRQAEKSLEENEQFLRSIYDGVQTPIFVLDVLPDGRCLFAGWNHASELATGILSSEITGKTSEEIFGEEQGNPLQQFFNQCIDTGSSISVEQFFVTQGQEKWWLGNYNPLKNDQGLVYRIIGTSIDITARKNSEFLVNQKSEELKQALENLQETQLQMIQSEKMSALGNLVAGVAHEINNPIGFLRGNIQPALDYIEDLLRLLDLYEQKYPQVDPEIKQEIETIDLEYLREDLPKLIGSMQEGVKRIQDISTSLRTFSRADRDYPVACNIHDGLDSTIMILKHRLKANEFRPEIQVIKIYGDVPQLKCYAGQLNQVFMNLLANAIDMFDEAAQESSFQDLQSSPQKITIQTDVVATGHWLEIRIRDNGKGMTEDIKNRIFDHLFTTKNVGHGTGLGLAIARQIVTEKHSGHLTVVSELGQGSEFCIQLPISI